MQSRVGCAPPSGLPRSAAVLLAMNFDQQRLVTGLILAATALFLVAVAPGFRYRRTARRAAIALYAAAAVVVIGLIVLWLMGVAV